MDQALQAALCNRYIHTALGVLASKSQERSFIQDTHGMFVQVASKTRNRASLVRASGTIEVLQTNVSCKKKRKLR